MKIVLVGYMGSGKTTVGKLLANKLSYNFLDLDDYIEGKLETKISNIFRDKGEIYFRKKEHLYLSEALQSEDDLVLSLGGGTPCYAGNMDTILQTTQNVFYLKLSIQGVLQRLFDEKESRPLISHLKNEDLPEYIAKHLFERAPFYTMARHTLVCDSKDAQTISEEIIQNLV